jgi:integrase
MRVPKDLQHLLKKSELRYSLKTGYLGQAKHRARLLAGLVQRLIYQLREHEHDMKLTEKDIAEIIDLFKSYALEPYLSWNQEQAEEDGSPGIVEMHGDLRTRIDRLKMALKAGPERESWITSKLDSQLKGMQYNFETEIDRDSPQYRDLCRKVVKATVEQLSEHREKLEFDYSELELGQGGSKRQVSVGSQSAEQQIETTEGKSSMTLKPLIQEYSEQQIKVGNWKQNVVRNQKAKCNALLSFLGDVPVEKVTKNKMRTYRKLLDGLPPYFSRRKAYKDLSTVDIDGLKGKHDQTLDITTIREYMIIARAIFQYAEDMDYITVNPVLKGMVPPKKKGAKEQRLTFTADDLKLIFNSETYFKFTNPRPALFWVPILGLYTGCRIEELCQLYCDDVKKVDGIWCLDINDDNDKQLKNEPSERIVPLHPFLVEELGFHRYVAKVRRGKHQRVFYGESKRSNKYSHYVSRRFGDYKKGLGFDKKKVFHSFRHTFTDLLYKNEVMETMIEEITGRAGKTETSKRYAKGYRIRTMYEQAILKLYYGIDLTHLKESKYVVKN